MRASRRAYRNACRANAQSFLQSQIAHDESGSSASNGRMDSSVAIAHLSGRRRGGRGRTLRTSQRLRSSLIAFNLQRASNPVDEICQQIAEICRRLDGIPLALEFAAARVAELGLREIAARLDDCFGILTRGRRTALPRHRTLAAAFDWSYSLLSEDEQRMLAHLAALRGSFTADRAIASCLDSACKRRSEAFYSLFDKSFLAVEMAIEEPTFRLLETTRAYAAGITNAQSSQQSICPTVLSGIRLSRWPFHVRSAWLRGLRGQTIRALHYV
jgi:predicted ATPase